MFRSRWGFHPCDYETYRRLKFLNQLYLKAVRLAHGWQRWKRKDAHNRVICRHIRNELGQTVGYEPPVPLAEPKICPVFTRMVLEKRHVDKKGRFFPEGFIDEGVVTDDFGVAADYAAARTPAADQTQVRPLHRTVAELDALCAKARHWLETLDAM
jgi:hypothetical protein